MPNVTLFDQSGSQKGNMDIAEGVFGIEPNTHVLHEAVVMQQASQRQGTHHTKNRSKVRGGGRKPWRQKGTGNARQGSIRAPQWVGGGVVFGPTPRNYNYNLPKKVRKLALKSALSAKVQDNELLVLEELTLEKPRTKDIVNLLANLSVDNTKVLVVTADFNEAVSLSARNIPGVTVITSTGVNVLEVLNHDKLIMTQDAVKKTEEVLDS